MVWTVFASATVRVMPLGDSLSRGCCPDDSGCDLGYRYPRYKKLVNEGLDVNFVGSQKHPQDICSIYGVSTDFDRDHEGYYGKRADQVRDDIYGNLAINPVDIVLLHIGTNDLLQNQTINSTVDEISQIINNINLFATNHSRIIHVILARINNKVPESNIWSQFNIELASRWYGSNVDIVDMEYDPGFIYEFDPVGDFKDDPYDVHPIQPDDDDAVERGYEKMVGVWYDALKPYFIGPYNAWTTRTSGTYENLYGVARGNGTYVAVGFNGTIIQRSYAPGDDCGPEMVVDCLNGCVFSNRLGDGHCDDYLYPNFDCIEFNYDEGDCIHPGDELAADFGTNGLWHYDGASWSKKTPWHCENMGDVDLN
jgi:hypothetical protein